ncbi:MAG: MFS transporter [Elusimicrobia bacterium]|nr:MFS transporter [Elusimicrobiota bacterium]
MKSILSSLLALALILSPFPAWSQVARAIYSPDAAASRLALPADAIGSAPAPLSAPALSAALAPHAAGFSAAPAAALNAQPAATPAAALAAAPAAPALETEESVRGKTVVMVGTKGSRPFIMEEAVRVAKELGLNLVLVDDPANRANSKDVVPDSHFIPAPINTRDAKTMGKIAETVASHAEGAKAHAVVGFMSLYANLTGKITDRLGARGIPGVSVAAADDKPTARKILNTVSELRVPFREVKNVAQARKAYHEISGEGRYKVVLKTIRGENSRFLAMSIASEEAAVAEYLKMDAAVRDFVSRPEAKQTTFSAHPGIMMERMLEKKAGTEETSVEVVMQNGKAAFAIVSDTKGIGPKGELAGGIMVFPSQQPPADHAALIAASEHALNAIGIVNGNARLDMMTTPDGPRVIEINPFMGGVAIWQAVKSLTGMNLVEQGLRAVLGLPVDPGHAADGVLHYIFLASSRNGTLVDVEGLKAAQKLPGVELARSFVSPGDSIVAAKGNAYEEWAEVIGKGATWREAIEAALSAARRMVLRIKRANGEIVRARGDYQQPTADDLAPLPSAPAAVAETPAPAAEPAPKLFSKAVVGFLSTFVLVSTVVESTSLAVSQMTQPLSQGFMALAALTSVSYAAYTLGSFFGGSVIKRLGIRTSYRSVLAIRALIWTAMALLFNPATGTIALAALIPLFSLDYFFHSIGRVAEHSLQVAWFQNSEAASSRFGSFRDFIEYGSVFVGSAMALAVAKFGFAAVIYPAAPAFAVAALIALALNLPKAAPDRKPGKWSDGFKTVFRDPGIFKPLAGFALVNSFLYMMYYITATAFGAYAAPDPQHAAAVAGSLTAVYGAGALVGSVVMDRMAARIDNKAQALPEGERKAGERRLYIASAAKVLPWAAAALLGSWLFTLPMQIGTVIWPIFPVSLALLAIGFTAQMASNHLDVIMKSNIPKGEKDMAVGAIRTLTYATHVVGFLVWGGLFALFGPHAFFLFAAFYTFAAAAYLWLARSLKK